MTSLTPPNSEVNEADRPRPDFGTFKVTSAAHAATYGYCFLLTSPKGGGKTSLAASLDDYELERPVLMVDAEGGSKAISHRAGVDVIQVFDWDEVRRLTDGFISSKEPLRWKTIALDNLSAIVTFARVKVTKSEIDGVTQPEWLTIANMVLSLVGDYRNLARTRGINSILVAWDSIEEDKAHKPYQHVQATPMIQRDLPGMVDIVGHIDIIDGKPDQRMLVLEPSTHTINKFRRNPKGTALTVPYRLPYGVDNFPLGDIMAALKHGVEFPVSKYVEGAVKK